MWHVVSAMTERAVYYEILYSSLEGHIYDYYRKGKNTKIDDCMRGTH